MKINERANTRASKSAGVIENVLKAGAPLLLALSLVACGGGGGGGGSSTGGGGGATPANQAGTVAISGTATQNQILTATVSDGNGVPATVAYQWMANGTAIAGATARTYGLTQAEVGKTITVKATYTDNNGYAEAPVSAATAAVADVNDAPTISFAPSGVTIMKAGTNTTFVGVKVATDGKIVAAGSIQRSSTNTDFLVARYNSDGSPDTTFGTNGVATLDFAGGNDFITTRPVIQADGRILVVGYTVSATTGRDFAVARLNADGSPDATFGTNGWVVVDFAQRSDTVGGLAVALDNKILLGGTTQLPVTSGSNLVGGAVRLLANGALDAGFGTGGKGTSNFGVYSRDYRITDIAVAPNGQIYALDANWYFVARFSPEGELDTSYGQSGIAPVLQGYGNVVHPERMRLDASGAVLVAGWRQSPSGSSGYNFVVSRILPSGQSDRAFGVNGLAEVDLAVNNDDFSYDLAIRGDGKIFVAGTADSTAPMGRGNVAVALLNANGQIDTTFGGTVAGKVQRDISGFWDTAYALDLQSDGKIVLAGAAQDQGRANGPDAFVMRLTAGGTIDANFGAASGVYHEGGSPAPIAAGHASDLDLPANGNYNGYRLALQRDGTADAGDVFSATGSVSIAGGALTDRGVVVGTATQSTGVLTLVFNDKATQAAVDEVVSALAISHPGSFQSGRAAIQWVFTDPQGASSTAKTNFYFADDYGDNGDAEIDIPKFNLVLMNHWQGPVSAYMSKPLATFDFAKYLFDNYGATLSDTHNSGVFTSITGASIALHVATLSEAQALYQAPGRPAAWSSGVFLTSTPMAPDQYGSSTHATIDMATGAVRAATDGAKYPFVLIAP